MKKMTFALFFGNRGFFPGELIHSAREDLEKALSEAGFGSLAMPAEATRFGAVETAEEGRKFARFLEENRGRYDGVILSLPNFGDENGAAEALPGCGVPILVQAFPDEAGRMDFAHRRDALCGKLAVCNVLRQNRIPYTLLPPFAVHPADPCFPRQLEEFAAVCRVVNGMRRFNIGAFGARTTAFKTVRYDEVALQERGINVETFDLSELFGKMRKIPPERAENLAERYREVTVYEGFPAQKLLDLARLQLALEDYIDRYRLHALALRCWNEFQLEFGIAPCLVLGMLNEKGVQAACELDVANAVMMRALSLAAGRPSMLLDVNNNAEGGRCILFHCGPAAPSLLSGKGRIIEHEMFKKSYGAGSGVGVNRGRIRPGPVTAASLKTQDGGLCAFVTEGRLSEEEMEEGFFGCGTVFEGPDTEGLLTYMGKNGYRHHIALAPGQVASAVFEALNNYLGYRTEKI